LNCGVCGKPVQQQFFRALDRFACTSCAAKLQAFIVHNRVGPDKFAIATVAGLAAAMAGGAGWAVISHATKMNIGYIAFLIGLLVARVMVFASGKRRAVSLQYAATILSVLGVAIGKIIFICWIVADQAANDGKHIDMVKIVLVVLLHLNRVLEPMDLLWMAIAGYAAWRACKPPKFSIAGPYAYQPATGAQPSMEFDTLEPLPQPVHPPTQA
jgi:hypothetical protein